MIWATIFPKSSPTKRQFRFWCNLPALSRPSNIRLVWEADDDYWIHFCCFVALAYWIGQVNLPFSRQIGPLSSLINTRHEKSGETFSWLQKLHLTCLNYNCFWNEKTSHFSLAAAAACWHQANSANLGLWMCEIKGTIRTRWQLIWI